MDGMYQEAKYLSLGWPAGQYLLSKISKSGQGQHSVYSVGMYLGEGGGGGRGCRLGELSSGSTPQDEKHTRRRGGGE
jgi:hypothetical protein